MHSVLSSHQNKFAIQYTTLLVALFGVTAFVSYKFDYNPIYISYISSFILLILLCSYIRFINFDFKLGLKERWPYYLAFSAIETLSYIFLREDPYLYRSNTFFLVDEATGGNYFFSFYLLYPLILFVLVYLALFRVPFINAYVKIVLLSAVVAYIHQNQHFMHIFGLFSLGLYWYYKKESIGLPLILLIIHNIALALIQYGKYIKVYYM